MKNCRIIVSGMFLSFIAFTINSGPVSEQMRGSALRANNSTFLTKEKDTSIHLIPCVKIHHPLFQKMPVVSVNSDGKHYLQVFDSKGMKLNEYTFTGKRYKLDTHTLAKGSYTIYVYDEHKKLLDLKPMVVK